MSTFQSEFGKGTKIIIPSIQRDYVQPLNEAIIRGFVEVLVKAFSRGENKDLNYLYGIHDEEGNFIPIDGQQRLTTLWLLHLYVAARLGTGLGTTIEYQTRDISGDFCKALSKSLVRIEFNRDRISENIRDASWFIGVWYDSVTVKSILIALDEIHKVVRNTGSDLKKMWNNMLAGAKSPVQFAFHNPENLGKDIYVKMNSRGRALTPFENLKAWLDDKLKFYSELYRVHSFSRKFYNEWRVEIDNEWTDFFWRNRNINSDFPEEIDDGQLRLFYTIAYVVWAQKTSKLRARMDLSSMGTFDSEKVLSRMRETVVDIPMYELNMLDIFNEEVLLFARRAIKGLIRLENRLNEDIQVTSEIENETKVFFWENTDPPLKFIYRLLLSEREEKIPYTKIASAASVLFFASQDIDAELLLEWVRFTRNIVNNSRIESENIHNILSALRKWTKRLKLLSGDNKYKADKAACWHDFIKGLGNMPAIDRAQIAEEKKKCEWLIEYPECAATLHKLENHRFFFGRISFLMNYIYDLKEKNTGSIAELFITVAGLLYKLFDSDGPNRNLNLREGYIFHRAVLALSEYHGYGIQSGANWILSNTKDSWKEYIEDFDSDNPVSSHPHNIGFIRLIDRLKDNVEGNYESIINGIIDRGPSVSDWRKELVVYPDLWDYMESKNLRFDGNNRVFLLKRVTLGNRNRRAELRTRGLYSYLKKSVFFSGNEGYDDYTVSKDKISLNGWSLNFWDYFCSERKNSCLYFQKEIEGHTIALDVYFDTTQNKEEAYCIEIFDRKGQKERKREISELSLFPFQELLKQNDFVWNDNGYIEKRNLSKRESVDFLKEFIPYGR